MKVGKIDYVESQRRLSSSPPIDENPPISGMDKRHIFRSLALACRLQCNHMTGHLKRKGRCLEFNDQGSARRDSS